MMKFNKKFDYKEFEVFFESVGGGQKEWVSNKMDPEVIDLCNAMNALPGIKTIESCSGHSCSPLSIYFKVTDEKGLAFLTRCVDHRYWKYGYLWKITLTIGDTLYNDGHLPITYILSSDPIVGEDAYSQAQDLVRNMNDHLNITAFLEFFKLKLSDFDLK